MGKPALSNQAKYGVGMLGAENTRQQSLLDMVAKTAPERVNIDYNRLNTLGKDYGYLNAMQSKALERQVDPNNAAIREGLAADMAKTQHDAATGNLPVELKNQMLRAGLTEGLGTTGNVKQGSQGLSNLGNIYGTKFLDYQNMVRQMAGQYLQANPLAAAGLDPSSAMNLFQTNQQDNANLTNSWRQQLLQAQGNSNATMSNMGGQLFSGAVNEGNSNTQAKNADAGQKIAAGAAIAGTVVLGAAAIF